MSDSMAYISSAHIEGYKSIFNADVTFSPGLNVIIGKNGAGKSNLLHVLEGLLLEQASVVGTATTRATLIDADGSEVEFRSQFSEGEVRMNSPEKPHFVNSLRQWPKSKLFEENVLSLRGLTGLELLMVTHSIPKDVPFLDLTFSAKLSGSPLQFEGLWEQIVDPNSPYFSRASLAALFFPMYLADRPELDNVKDKLRNKFEEVLGFQTQLSEYLRAFTPITDFRLAEMFSIVQTGEELYLISNVAYEFQIGGKWFMYDDLSDGTKRMVYILLSFSVPRLFRPNDRGLGSMGKSSPPKIVFLEEPELGIHPHQLHQLLLFLKEQAKTQQIILTTHSPQVLDILDKDELDKIIIATYGAEKGSQFHHLTMMQQNKALAYMEELRLSDYWLFSNLEPSVLQ